MAATTKHTLDLKPEFIAICNRAEVDVIEPTRDFRGEIMEDTSNLITDTFNHNQNKLIRNRE